MIRVFQVNGYIVVSYDNAKSIMTKVFDDYAEECIYAICDRGYTFEGLSFSVKGSIDTLYFRKEE